MQEEYPNQEENIKKVLDLIDKMQEILSKFTNHKLEMYMKVPELSFLLKYYMRQNLDPICESDGYQECQDIILKACCC